MTVHHRHSNTRRLNLNGRVAHDLPRLVHHLHLFFGVARIEKIVDLGHAIEGDGMGKFGWGWLRRAGDQGAGLVIKLAHALLSCSGNSLIGADNDPFDLIFIMDRLQGHHHLNGRAIRVGDNALVPVDILRIDFRDDQRNGGIHAPGGTVVDHHSTGSGCGGACLF